MTAIDKVQYLQIGVQGENAAMDIEFDMTAWAELYPDATFHILFKPYNETEVSPQISTYDSETKVLKWTVGYGATAVVGVGYTEVRAQDGNELIKKTRVIPTAVENSVSGAEINPPAAYADWVTNVLNAGAAVVALAHGAEISFSIDDDGHLVYSYTDEDEETTTVDLGPVDAYAMAVAEGYEGTKEEFEQYMADVANAADDAEDSAEAAAASAAAAELAKTYAQLFTGAPRTAAAAADMTDTDKIYVFTGTTTSSLTNGHWYYHNGTAWTDGGAYNSTALTTDTTLAVSGAAADAKVTGDKLAEQKSALDDLNDAVFDIVEESDNKYNSALVTSETVSTDKRLYGNGTLKDATGIDVSPFMPIKPSTDYWMGLVPPYDNTGVPWYGQSVAIEFYSAPSESSQISRIDRVDNNAITFTTPSNANYYRFNIARSSISPSVVNSRCMLVEGSTAPSEYEPYSEYSKESKLTSIIDTMDDVVSGNIFNNYTPVVGKYYDGTEHPAESYNYYVVPVLKGVKYMVLPKMRMHVIKVGSTNVVIDTTDKKTSFTPTVNGVAYITVYAADTPMLFIANTDKTLTIDGKAADAKVTGDILFKVENYCKNYNLTLFANSHVLGKYYSLSGSVGTNASYNYYEKIPVVSGNTYLFTGKGARYCVLYNNNEIVQTAENVSTFTANYDGDLYVTEYVAGLLSMYIYNDFYKITEWTNANVNSSVLDIGQYTSKTFNYSTTAGDLIHLKLKGYTGNYFTNCLLYSVENGNNIIRASLYSDTGECVFIAPTATRYVIYVNRSQTETATLAYELTNLTKATLFNTLDKINILNRLAPQIYGKKIACLGDSFTYGVATYVSKLNDRYLSHAINYGVASSRIVLDTTSGGTTISSFLNRYSAMDNDADIITVFGGINDSYDIGAGNLALGTIDSPLDTNTFYGGLKLLVTNLMKKYTDKQIIGIIPPDCQIGQYYIDNLPDVQQAEREVYGMYGIPIIDIRKECYKMSTLPEMVALYRAASDNIHPSGAGQEALCDTIAAGIRRIIP